MEKLRWNLLRLLDRIDGAPRLFQHPGADVGGQYFALPSLFDREVFQQEHGQRVRFFTAGASRAPDPQAGRTVSGRAFMAPARENMFCEEIEMPRLAEKMRLVRGDAVDHHRALVLLVGLRDEFEILSHVLQREQPQPPRQSSGEQCVLVLAQPYPALVINELLIFVEQPRREQRSLVNLAVDVLPLGSS